MVHLVYCDNVGKKGEHVLDLIMSGKKTMIIRGAAGRKIPHSRVFKGETLYFMEKGTKSISAKAIVKNVQNYIKLSDAEINQVILDNNTKLALNEKQQIRWHKSCLCLIEFEDVVSIKPSLAFEKQTNMDDWLILNKMEDVLVGSSNPFNYNISKLN